MTRAAGLDRLAAFLAGAGADYAACRNTDRGPGHEPTTSALSPYLRRRLITEAEVAAAGFFDPGHTLLADGDMVLVSANDGGRLMNVTSDAGGIAVR